MIDYASYFSLGDCMEGLNLIFNRLYDINLIFEDVEPGEGWADRVYKLAGNFKYILFKILLRNEIIYKFFLSCYCIV